MFLQREDLCMPWGHPSQLIQWVSPHKILSSFKPHIVELIEKMLEARVAGNQNLEIKELISKSTEEAPLWMLFQP